jgi:hypothetical protein
MSFRPIVALVLASLLLPACGSAKPETAASVDTTKVSIAGEGTDADVTKTTKSDDDFASMDTIQAPSGSWPENAPAFAPAYPGGKVYSGNSSGEVNGKAYVGVSFSTTDSPAKVFDYYKPLATAAGLTNVTTTTTEGVSSLSATGEKGDFGLTVMATTSDGTTNATVQFSRPG